MVSKDLIGLYGKLPGYGDFLNVNLPQQFIDPWDEWLQFYISVPRDQIGDSWLETYLNSPIWRFVISAGVIDENCWMGILMPSVDRVGRYFPLSIVFPLSGRFSVSNLLQLYQPWFSQVEEYCISALEEDLDLEQLLTSIHSIELSEEPVFKATSHLGSSGAFVLGLNDNDETSLNSALIHSLDASFASSGSFSLWQTDGSDQVGPSLFCCNGLPPIGGLSAMMDGQWQEHQWKIPYNAQA